MKKFIPNQIKIAALIVLLSIAPIQSQAQKMSLPLENKTSVKMEARGLQPPRFRSLDMMRIMVGAPMAAKAFGPTAAVEWSTRISHQNPLFAAGGISYLLETKQNNEGEIRDFYQVPIYLNIGFASKITKNWKASLAAGPVLRQIFESGESRSYAYGDLVASAGLDYEWINPLTGIGQSIGLRGTRMFGLANVRASAPIDSIYAGFAFDL